MPNYDPKRMPLGWELEIGVQAGIFEGVLFEVFRSETLPVFRFETPTSPHTSPRASNVHFFVVCTSGIPLALGLY